MARSKVSTAVRERVARRAAGCCEYCHASERWQYVRFTIDHVVPRDRGGTDDPDNLALACFHCNRRKSNRSEGSDPESGVVVPLFDPRRDRWEEHFIWSADGLQIVGLTPTGRATVEALALNRGRVLAIRAADREIDRHPPVGDPVRKGGN